LAPFAGGTVLLRFTDCDGELDAAQHALAARFAAGAVDDRKAVAAALMPLWNLNAEDVGLRPVKRAQDLRGKLRIGVVYIHPDRGDRAGVQYGYGGEWDVDPEHGFGVLMQAGKVLDAGHESVAFG
jgi:hypothetical protein